MSTKTSEPLIGADGEVREITMDDLKLFRPGRPPLPLSKRKQRLNLMLDPDVIDRLRAKGDMSARVNALLRRELGLEE